MAEPSFGCFYNPRPSPGRCIKDPRSKVVEEKCMIENNACKLKTVSVPTRATAEKMATVQPSKGKIVRDNITDAKLSGPFSAYTFTYQNNKYHLFGDVHFSMSGTCHQPCKSIIPGQRECDSEGSVDCWEISRLLSDIFNRAEADKEYVDFYIEMPFLPKGQYKPSMEDIKSAIPLYGEMYKLYYIFYECFNKIRCKYNYVRFHYVDVRLQYKVSNLPRMLSDIIQTSQPVNIKPITFEHYITSRIGESIEILGGMMIQDIRETSSYIETTDGIVKKLYFSGGRTMEGYTDPLNVKLFKLYLQSNNFTEDVMVVSRELLGQAKSETDLRDLTEALLVPSILVNRNGKNMHRVRAQLDALEMEGKQDISRQIQTFVLETYIKNINISSLMTLWDKFMKTYNNYVYARSRTLGDTQAVLERLVRDFRELMNIQSLTVSSTATLMDAYLLARMNRSFPGTNHVDSKTKIVYAGNAHTENYVEYFKRTMGPTIYHYGGLTRDVKSPDVSRCIDINVERFLY